MALLLDTHAFIWWLAGDDRLSESARKAIGDSAARVFVSAASAWEIATKVRLGKLPGAEEVARDPVAVIEAEDFEPLSIGVLHAAVAGQLPGPHRDPFDRMLIAQALAEELTLVTNERLFEAFGVDLLW